VFEKRYLHPLIHSSIPALFVGIITFVKTACSARHNDVSAQWHHFKNCLKIVFFQQILKQFIYDLAF
jgi:hypothetical protein